MTFQAVTAVVFTAAVTALGRGSGTLIQAATVAPTAVGLDGGNRRGQELGGRMVGGLAASAAAICMYAAARTTYIR